MCTSSTFIFILVLQLSQFIRCNVIGNAGELYDDDGELIFAHTVSPQQNLSFIWFDSYKYLIMAISSKGLPARRQKSEFFRNLFE